MQMLNILQLGKYSILRKCSRGDQYVADFEKAVEVLCML